RYWHTWALRSIMPEDHALLLGSGPLELVISTGDPNLNHPLTLSIDIHRIEIEGARVREEEPGVLDRAHRLLVEGRFEDALAAYRAAPDVAGPDAVIRGLAEAIALE